MNIDTERHLPRALIVEDELLIAEELSELLLSFGFIVIASVDTAEEGIAMAVRELPDVVLMDIRLRGEMDGIQAAREIRRQVDLPIVYLTAYSDRATVDRAKHSEHDAYLLKPFQRQELYSTIEVAIRRHTIRSKRKEN